MNRLWEKLPEHLKDNPVFHYSEETDYVPAWDKIRAEHIEPAMDFVFENFYREMDEIASNPAVPNYKNTVEAMESLFSVPMYLARVMYAIMPRDQEEKKRQEEVENKVWKKFIKAYYDLFTNDAMYLRYRVFAMGFNSSRMKYERLHLAGMYATGFTESGAEMPEEKRKEMIRLSYEISELGSKAQKNMRLAEEKTFVTVTDPGRLRGLPGFLIESAAKKAENLGQPGAWVFGVGSEVYMPFMQSAEDRTLRREMWQAFHGVATKGEYDNRDIILQLIKLEHQHARLRGYRNPATANLRYNIARTPKAVEDFLTDLRRAAKPQARKEMAVLRAYARENDGVTRLNAWDIPYYMERVKKATLGYDEEELRPYFELEHVLQATYRHFEKLFGLKFEEVEGYPKYDQDLRFVRVTDKRTGKNKGLICMDLYARDGKPAGIAWNMSVLQQGMFEGKNRRSFDMVVTKFVKGQGDDPTLLSHEDVQTLMHELGHATHNMLSECLYQSTSGTSVDTDFVEFPSQIQEDWIYEPTVLDDFARHWQTGEKLSDDVKEKIAESRKFMTGYTVLRRAEKSWLDLAWYRQDPRKVSDLKEFENLVLSKFRLPDLDNPMTLQRFSHIHGGGYEASFYSYLWSERMSKDLFAKFKKVGLYDRSLASAYKKALAQGGSTGNEEGLFKGLMHRNVLNTAFLKAKGLKLGTEFNYAAALAPREERAANDNTFEAGAAVSFAALKKGPQPG